mmetsp:Transcript_12345/g.18501  ORF Transcript_12345/g.18501 Transcript_12345/m.18501 type:complete len:141 (+) Transcript_12345:284-706(+)
MQRNFVELQRFLEYAYPELRGEITGGHYPPPLWVQKFAVAAQTFQLGGTVFTLVGPPVLRYLIPSKPQYPNFLERKRWPIIGFLFVVTSIANSKLSTGAFEVYLDGELIFSKLRKGTFPKRGEILGLFSSKGLTLNSNIN